jgi:hypothetical protein
MISNEVKNMPNHTSGACGDAVASASRWIKSSLSFANGDCIEVASLPDGRIGVRDSKDPEGPILRFTSSEWRAFVGGVRDGEFDHLPL